MPASSTGYQGMLQNAQSMYSGILAGYQRALSSQQSAQRGVISGYNTLSSNVMGRLEGIGESRSQEIADYYSQQTGAANQQLINRGLGNTTVASSVGRGMSLDQTKAQTQLSNLLAGQAAQYQTQIGLSGLGYQGQAIGQNTALMGQSLGYQGDWQRSLLGAGMQGAGLDQQYSMAQMRGGGGGYGGGGSRSSGDPSSASADAWSRNLRADIANQRRMSADAERIDLHEGMGGGGGYSPYVDYGALGNLYGGVSVGGGGGWQGTPMTAEAGGAWGGTYAGGYEDTADYSWGGAPMYYE